MRYPITPYQFCSVRDDLARRVSGMAGIRAGDVVQLGLRMVSGGTPTDPSSWIVVCSVDLTPSGWLRKSTARDAIFVWPDDPSSVTRSRIESQLRRSGVDVAAP